MAVGLQNQNNITAPDSDYPDGSIKDDTGSDDGTPVDKRVYDDLHQTFAKILRTGDVTPNGLPDNEYNLFQYFQAMRNCFKEIGSYIDFDRSISILVSGKNSPLIKVQAGAPNVGVIGLEDSATAEFDLGTATFVNKSSFTCPISPGGSDTIDGGGTYNLIAGARVKLCQVIAESDWVIIDES